MFLKKIATFATILAVLILGAIAFSHASASATPLASAQKLTDSRPSVATGYPVNINSTGQNNDSFSNPDLKPLIIIAKCNATVAPKDLEGWVRLSSPPTNVVNDMVASLSGTARQTITFVVPWNWYYRVNVNVPAGGDCSATAWLTY